VGVGGVIGMRRRASPFKLNLAIARLFKPIVNLKPEYRLALARDGYVLVKCALAAFKPEA